jgi:hypothetical protein
MYVIKIEILNYMQIIIEIEFCDCIIAGTLVFYSCRIKNKSKTLYITSLVCNVHKYIHCTQFCVVFSHARYNVMFQ